MTFRSQPISSFVGSVLCVALVAGAHGEKAGTKPLPEQVRAFYNALARSDTAALSLGLTDDAVWTVGPTGGRISRATLLAAAARPQQSAPSYQIDSLEVRPLGRDAATVEYVRTDAWPIGKASFRSHWRALDVFVMDQKRWRLARHTQAWLVTPVTPALADSASLQPFVGRYEIAAGYIDDVHWEGRRLIATASGQSAGAELVQVAPDAFSPDGVGSLIVFERNAEGRVLDYVQGYPDGRIVHAVRLP